MTLFACLICILAGIGAGVGTGFAGLSAAAFIGPLLIYLGVDAFVATGIGLASDILASAASAVAYHKEGNIDLKNGKPLIITVPIFSILGTLVAHFLSRESDGILKYIALIGALWLGIQMIIKSMKEDEEAIPEKKHHPLWMVLLCGSYIGFVCGFMGTGGGMMMLLVLTVILGYELKMAVGTSVFLMAFTAFIGSVSHTALAPEKFLSHIPEAVICILVTLIAAWFSAKAANHMKAKYMKLITGILLSGVAVFTFLTQIL